MVDMVTRCKQHADTQNEKRKMSDSLFRTNAEFFFKCRVSDVVAFWGEHVVCRRAIGANEKSG